MDSHYGRFISLYFGGIDFGFVQLTNYFYALSEPEVGNLDRCSIRLRISLGGLISTFRKKDGGFM